MRLKPRLHSLDGRLLAFFFVILLIFSCKKNKDKPNKEVEHLFNKLASATVEEADFLFPKLDSLMTIDRVSDLEKVNYYRLKAVHAAYFKKSALAVKYDDTAIALASERLDEKQFWDHYIDLSTHKGDQLVTLKRYGDALSSYAQVKLFYNKQIRDSCANARFENRIAKILYFLGRYQKAATYFRRAYETRLNCESYPEMQFMEVQMDMDNTGLAYLGAGMLDSAEYYFRKANDFIVTNEHKFPRHSDFINLAKAVVQGNLGVLREKQGRYAESLPLLKASISQTGSDDPDYAIIPLIALAKLSTKTKDFEAAENAIKKLNNRAGSFGLGVHHVAYLEVLKDYYEMRGDLPQAHFYDNAFRLAKDSIDNFTRQAMDRDFEEDFKNKEQRVIRELLEKDNEIKSFQLTIAFLVAIIAGGVVLFFYHNLRKSSAHIKTLKQLNQQISEQNEQLFQMFVSLEQSHTENTELTRIVAHDLRNPISGVRSLASSLLKRKGQSEEMREDLELIRNACINSLSLISDLLADKTSFTKIEKETVDIGRVVQNCVLLLQTKADEKNQQIEFNSSNVIIPANTQKIWRVVSNLINNAIKFSPPKSVINVSMEVIEDSCVISVKDPGIGIPEHLKSKIFSSDPVASRMGTAGEESHGLGLAISKTIVEEHGGRIWFESEQSAGSVFYVELPCAS